MIALPPKPPGSGITVEHDFNRLTLSWKNPRGGVGRYAMLAFMLVWMGGWVFGEFFALTQVLGGKGDGFLVFWLAGWTVGGVYCGAMIFKLAQPTRPERIILDPLQLEHHPGTVPISWPGRGRGQRTNAFDILKPRRKRLVPKKEVGDIRLDRVGERQRLSFDHGAKRIEVGEFLEEPEREWLFAVLKSWKSV
jgi:hypothetical protein